MKIYYYNKTVRAEAESLTDIRTLLALSFNDKPVMGGVREEITQEKVEPKKHRKHNFKKPCPECGKLCKGSKGLGTHRSNLHGVRSPLYEENRRYRLLKKEKDSQATPASVQLEVKHG